MVEKVAVPLDVFVKLLTIVYATLKLSVDLHKINVQLDVDVLVIAIA